MEKTLEEKDTEQSDLAPSADFKQACEEASDAKNAQSAARVTQPHSSQDASVTHGIITTLEAERDACRALLKHTFNVWLDYQSKKYEMHSSEDEALRKMAWTMPASEGALLDACVLALDLDGWRGSVRPVVSEEENVCIRHFIVEKHHAKDGVRNEQT